MQKLAFLTAIAVLATASVAYLTRSGRNRGVVVDAPADQQASEASSRVPLDQVDQSVWNRLLKKYVNQDGMVNYAAWNASAADRAALREYLDSLGRADPEAKTTLQGKVAFWINAYNSLTVYGILQFYPTRSIREHTAKVVGYNIWKDLLLHVGDKKYSLDAIEHQILRKVGEPRIHFAIVCASIGCPRLLSEAYTPAKVESQLADNTRDFFARRKNFQADFANRRVRVSSILNWYGKDFGPTPQKALASLAQDMPDQATKRLVAGGDFSVSYLP